MHILLILFVKINLSLFKLLANSYDIARILVIISHTFSSLPHSLLIFLFILCVDGTFNIKLSFSLLLICICCNSFINLYVYGASLHDKVYKFNIYFFTFFFLINKFSCNLFNSCFMRIHSFSIQWFPSFKGDLLWWKNFFIKKGFSHLCLSVSYNFSCDDKFVDNHLSLK